MKRLTTWFLQGLLFVAPIAVTIWVFVTLFMWIDAPLGSALQKLKLTENVIPGVGFLITVVTAVLVCTAPGSDVKLVGFITRETLEQWGMSDSVAVYVPMAFNLGGNVIIAP